MMDKDPRFVQKMDKNTFLYLKELEYKVEDMGRQLDDLREAYAMTKAMYRLALDELEQQKHKCPRCSFQGSDYID
jgi:rubrerythrin